MQAILDRFILGIPRLYLKQFPYAWIALIALWTWPPNGSLIFLFIIVAAMALLQWRHVAWLSHMRREYAPSEGKFYVDRPPIPFQAAARSILILVIFSALAAFFINKQIGLSAWQVFLIIVSFMLTYRDALFFGAPVTYVITASGIGVHFAPGHLDYRLFLKFSEISRIERCSFQKGKGWDCFARSTNAQDGLLFLPKNPNGFSKRLEKLFIAPRNVEQFLAQLPYGFRP